MGDGEKRGEGRDQTVRGIYCGIINANARRRADNVDKYSIVGHHIVEEWAENKGEDGIVH